MRRTASRLCPDHQQAEDAVQEGLLLVRNHAHTFRAPAHPASDNDADRAALGWILSLTTHATVALYRRQKRKREQAIDQDERSLAAPRPIDDSTDMTDLVLQQLAKLPIATREPIVLHHLRGLELQEVSNTLRIPIGTAKTRIHRGLKLLRQRMQRLGVAVSLLTLVGMLGDLSGSEAFNADDRLGLFRSSVKPSRRLPSRNLIYGMTLATILCAAAICICAIETASSSHLEGNQRTLARASSASSASSTSTPASSPAPTARFAGVDEDRGGASPERDAPTREVNYSGKMIRNEGTKLVLLTALAGASVNSITQIVKLSPSTTVTISGRPAKISDLQEEADIGVVCDGNDVALSVTQHDSQERKAKPSTLTIIGRGPASSLSP